MAVRQRLQTLEDFLGDSEGCRTSAPLAADSPPAIVLSIRTLSGDAALGPEHVRRGTTARELKDRLRESQPDSFVRLLHGQLELRDADLIDGGTRSGTVELTVVYTMEPTEEERKAWLSQLDGGQSLADLPAAARANRLVVLHAVRRKPESMQLAAAELRGDKEFMMCAVRRCGDVLRYADVELRRDAEIVMAALEYGVSPLRYADRALLASRNFMLAAVSLDGQALRYADKALRQDRDVVHAAMDQDETAWEHAEIDGDMEVERQRVKQSVTQMSTHCAMQASHDTWLVERMWRSQFLSNHKLSSTFNCR